MTCKEIQHWLFRDKIEHFILISDDKSNTKVVVRLRNGNAIIITFPGNLMSSTATDPTIIGIHIVTKRYHNLVKQFCLNDGYSYKYDADAGYINSADVSFTAVIAASLT